MKTELLTTEYETSKQIVKSLETKKIDHRYNGDYDYNINIETVYLIEDELTEEEKLKIIDYHTDSLGSYIIDIIEKYWKARDEKQIKESSWGLNLNSLKSWIKKNDSRDVLRVWYNKHYPTYYMFHNEFRLNRDLSTPKTDYSYKRLYDGKNIINQWFHDLLKELYNKEDKYYIENDSVQIKFTEINEMHNNLSDNLWKVPELVEIFNYHRGEVSEERINELYEALKNIKTYIADVVYDLNNK